MDWDIIQTIIGNYGFPIAACVALFYRMGKQDDMHRQEITALKESLDRNTEIITRLYEKIEG